MGLHFWRHTRAEDALVFLNKAYEMDPEDVEPIIAIAAVYEAIGWAARRPVESLEQTERAYQRVIERDSDNVEAHLRLGHVHKLRGNREDALRELHWVLDHAEEPDFKLVAHLLVGDLYKDKGSLQEAIESYRAALAQDPICQAAATALSQALHQTGDSSGARDVLDSFVERKGSRAGGFDGWWRYLHGDPKRIQFLLSGLVAEIR
jgi:tetratricopeptide (TPR) repeat protein